MKFYLTGYRNFYDLMEWCENNIGTKTDWFPLSRAEGVGWKLQKQPLVIVPLRWEIQIDDEQLALMFYLRFAETEKQPYKEFGM